MSQVQPKSENKQPTAEEVTQQLANFFTITYPRYENIVNKLSKNALLRLNKRLVSYPLNSKEMKATSRFEEEAFLLGRKVMESNFTMILDTLYNSEEIQKGLKQATEEVVQTEQTGEENNG